MPKSRITVTRSIAMNREETGAIIGEKGSLMGKILRLRANTRVLMGRDASQCDILLQGDMVSRVHCSIRYSAETHKYVVCDLSTNGILVNRQYMLEKRKETELPSGSRLFIGSDENIICLG